MNKSEGIALKTCIFCCSSELWFWDLYVLWECKAKPVGQFNFYAYQESLQIAVIQY